MSHPYREDPGFPERDEIRVKLGNVERTVRSLEQALGLSMVLAPGTTPQREAERAA